MRTAVRVFSYTIKQCKVIEIRGGPVVIELIKVDRAERKQMNSLQTTKILLKHPPATYRPT